MLKNGWVRLTVVAWVVWVLWTLHEQGWDLDATACSAHGVNPLCWVWDFALPPVLALGIWWIVRAFGKEAVATWAPGTRILLLVIAAAVTASTVYLRGRIRIVENDVSGIESKVDEVESTVGQIADALERR